jgi:hypothetical protein
MARLVFRRGEVEALAGKLDSLQHELSVDERALLIDIFEAAGDRVIRIQARGSDHREPTLPDLKDQLVKAFLPAEGNEFVLEFIERSARIGGEPFPH